MKKVKLARRNRRRSSTLASKTALKFLLIPGVIINSAQQVARMKAMVSDSSIVVSVDAMKDCGKAVEGNHWNFFC